MYIVLAVAIFLALLTVGGDYLVIMSIKKPQFMMTLLWGGVLLYGVTAFGWRYLFQNASVAMAAVLYSSLTTVMLVALGVLVFKETLSARTMLGVALAIGAILAVES